MTACGGAVDAPSSAADPLACIVAESSATPEGAYGAYSVVEYRADMTHGWTAIDLQPGTCATITAYDGSARVGEGFGCTAPDARDTRRVVSDFLAPGGAPRTAHFWCGATGCEIDVHRGTECVATQ